MAKVARAARVASRQRLESVSGTKVIESAETGELYSLIAASTITLPAPQDGAYFKFIVAAAISNTATAVVIQASAASVLMSGGVILHKHGTAVVQANDDASNDHKITIDANGGAGNKVMPGTVLECYSDGSRWVLSGMILTEGTVSVAFA